MSREGSERVERVREILDLALERPSGEREAFVAGAAGPDDALRQEVVSLLRALDAGGDSLEPPGMAPPEAGDAGAESLTGLRFGPYVVGDRLGEGGMGVVYATRDTRLERTVAVKALPPGLAKDPHRRARLEQEARLLAALSHPNIAAIYGVEDTPRGPVMILEFVPGRTLAQELAHGRLGLDETLATARQVARGLEAAHAAGIIHRDLKPSNIVITPDRLVKILDLGVAKGPAPGIRERGSDSVVRAAATQAGDIVGTVAYMSPEQARGRPVDRRTDLWAFGCVLYEMLTGQPAFQGDTASDVAAAVLRGEPDWARLPPGTPTGVRRLLRRCLEKDPDRRLRDAGDAILELDDTGPDPSATPRRGAPWTALAAASVLVVGVLFLLRRESPASQPPASFSIGTPPLVTYTIAAPMAVSPDGETLAFAGYEDKLTSKIYVRPLGTLASRAIPDTINGIAPFFSPDGRWIGYVEARRAADSRLMRVDVRTGLIETLVEQAGLGLGASWGDAGVIVFGHERGSISEITVPGGSVRPLLTAATEAGATYSQPFVVPGSRHVLFTSWRQESSGWVPTIEAIDRKTLDRTVVLANASQPCVASRDELLFVQGGWVMGAPFDVREVRVTGPARRVSGPTGAEDRGEYVRYSAGIRADVLAMIPGRSPEPWTDITWYDTDGSSATVYHGDFAVRTLRLSPDGSRVAFTTIGPTLDLWVLDLARGTRLRLTNGGGGYHYPVWTPDGKRIAYQHELPDRSSAVEWIASDGSGLPEVIHKFRNGALVFPTGFSPDAREMLLSALSGAPGATDIFVASPDKPGEARRLFESPADRVAARFSPDGALIAYASAETGRDEVYLHPYPAMDRKIQVSVDGGQRPTWSADGATLFFRFLDTIYSVSVSRGPPLEVGPPVPVLRDLPGDRYDPFPSGTRFIMCRPTGTWEPRTRIDVTLGWDRATPPP